MYAPLMSKPALRPATPPSLFALPTLRLDRVRHDCTNAAIRCAVHGHMATARAYARIAAKCDEVTQAPFAMTAEQWERTLLSYAQVVR